MKDKTSGNMLLRVLSVIIAIGVWLVVVNYSNPQVTRTKTVTLQIENADMFTQASKVYDLSTSDIITISYQVRTRDEYKIKSTDFRAYIDLSDVYEVTGSVPVNVEILENDDLIIGVPQARPQVVQVEIEDLNTQEYTLTVQTTGEVAEGYTCGDIETSDTVVTVSGPASIIRQIASVGCDIDISEASEDVVVDATPVFYDAYGDRLTFRDDRITVTPETISCTAHILHGKEVAVQFSTTGTPASGYTFAGIETSRNSVAAVAKKDILDSINTIVIPSSVLNLDGLTRDRDIDIDISAYMPEGVTIEGPSNITVRLKIEPLANRSYSLIFSQITQNNAASSYTYSISPSAVLVDVSATREDITGLTAAALNAQIDLSGMTIGTYTGVLTFSPPDGVTVNAYSDFEVVVTSSPVGPAVSIDSTTSASENSSGSSTSSRGDEGTTESTRSSTSTTQSSTQSTTESTTQRTTERTTENTTESTTESTTENTTEHTTERPTESRTQSTNSRESSEEDSSDEGTSSERNEDSQD